MNEENSTISTNETTFLKRISEGFTYEVYQDFQEYIFQQYRRPTLVYMVGADNSIRPCRHRGDFNRGFCKFCRLIRNEPTKPSQIHCCAKKTFEFINNAIENDNPKKGKKCEKGDWGWHVCDLGLIDLSLPIRDVDNKTILAIVNVGNGRAEGDDILKAIHKRVDEITSDKGKQDYFPNLTEEELEKKAKELHELAEKIPVISDAKKIEIKAEIQEAINLMEFISTHTLQRGMLYEGEKFIQGIGLDRVNIDINKKTLWKKLRVALEKILEYLQLDSAVVYFTEYGDYTLMDRVITIPSSLEIVDSVMFKSYEDFNSLTKRNMVALPHVSNEFSWFDIKKCFGTQAAILFARRIVGGHLILIGFGYNDIRPKTFQRAILYEAIKSKIFRFLDGSFLGITLDHLMVETGHLLGRARGKVDAGWNKLKDININVSNSEEKERLDDAMCSIEAGSMRLHLIRANFYSFREGRRQLDEKILSQETFAAIPQIIMNSKLKNELEQCKKPKEIDIVAIIEGLKKYFDQEIKYSKLSELRLIKTCDIAKIKGSEDDLKLVFLNLFSNALKFSYADTYIEIYIRKKANQCVIEFVNLGVGVASDEQKQVFLPMVKSRFIDSVKRTEGLGLGLSYCRRIIENRYNGAIILKSRKVEKPKPERSEGDNWITTVTIFLPLFDEGE